MKFLAGMVLMIVVATGCATDEQDIMAIRAELDDQTIGEYCMVSIGTLHGEKAYIIDTPIIVRDDNFEDCISVYCAILGCVGRAIESDAGYVRVVTESLYMDMSMRGVHECLDLANAGRDIFDALEDNLEWVDR